MLPPRPPRQEGPVRELPRRERSALTRGPKATIELLLTDDGMQRAVVECPRNALKAFSNLASQLLVSHEHTNLQIPPGNVALGALRYIMAWIPRTCEAADFMRKSSYSGGIWRWLTASIAIKRKDEFKQNVLVYQAALYLEITEVLTTIGGLLNMRIDSFERAPWSFDDASYVILTLPRDCGMVNRLIEKMALTRRRNNLDQVFLWQLESLCKAHPQLAKRFEEEDQPKPRQNPPPRRNSPAGDERDYSGRILSDREVDFIMCRHHR
ncbi:uncharacterized protein J3D65DRAFT_264610 [Phyllosticta citribraziliensis]|uniref:Uncharacterized protein n=1 Tax=Phyllosticta citribraziliensis TaxID=989973 RepID=A0ABR1M0R8_9PEZI